jgi:large subunit ribosomal protein L14
MISYLTRLDVADNSGARKIQCIKILKGSIHKTATIGDLIVVAIKKSKAGKKVKKGEIRKAVIVRIKKNFKRFDGSAVLFSSNAAILINAQMNPVGTRVFGPVTKELRQQKWTRILTMAPSIV